MRSPFSFISRRERVVTLAMARLELGDFAPPEVAVGQLRMRNGQMGLLHGTRTISHNIEIQRAWSPPLAALPASLGLDGSALREQRVGAQRGLEQHHLIQVRPLRHGTERS